MWKNMVGAGGEGGRPQMTTKYDAGQMGLPCWKAKVAGTLSEYMILIAFPWQQCLRERA